jgi:sugar phosphate isomerase/epimerase
MLLTRRQLLAGSATTTALLSGRSLEAASLEEVRLGVTTDEIDEDVGKAVDFLKGFGLHYAEIRSIWGKYNTQQPLEKVREARALMDAGGIKTSVLGTPFFRGQLPANNGELDKEWKLLDDAMVRAEIMGTRTLRTFAFMPKKGEEPTPADYARIYELETEAARRAQKRKMRLAVENLGGSFVSRGVDSAKLLRNVKEEALGLTWDPNNAAESGENAFPKGYETLDPGRIFHVHLRDFKHAPDGNVVWTAVGDGEFDNLAQIRALLKNGYKGTFTLETHFKHPDGKAAATRVSLTALMKIVEQV